MGSSSRTATKQRIDRVTTGVDVLFVAGNARSLIANRGDLIRAMQGRGLRVAALVPRADFLPEVEALGIPTYQFDLRRTGMNPVADFRSFLQLRGLIRATEPRAVFAYNIKPVIYGTLAAWVAGVPRRFAMITGLGHAYTTRSVKTTMVRTLTNFLYRVALGRAERVFFQNPDDLQQFTDSKILRDPRKAVRVNGSGVNLERFPPKPLPAGDPHFLFIGRLLTEKGVVEFVDAARRLKQGWPKARFTAVGGHDPSLAHALPDETLAEMRDAGVVEFVGAVKDVRPWLEECTVFVLPSYREGTPRSVLEAMATGRAVITTDAPGCRETVVDGVNGFLVPVGDASALGDAMERYLRDDELANRHGQGSLALVREKYDVNDVNQVILGAMGVAP